MKIKDYTLHGNYYLSDYVFKNNNWENACKFKKDIILPNGKTVVAHTLSKKELETIPIEQRKLGKWYWTSDCNSSNFAWFVCVDGSFDDIHIEFCGSFGGIRLGFHKNEIRQILNIE